MKKTLLTILIASFSLALTAQNWNVPKKNKGLVTKVTATWCGPCGSWGMDAYDDLDSLHSDDHLCMVMYKPGDYGLTSMAAQELYNEFGQSATPTFAGNGEDVYTSAAQVTPIVEGFAASDTVFANAAFEIKEMTCDTMVLKVKTKFFEQMAGTYVVKSFLVEDKIIAFQKDNSDSAMHHDVVRGRFLASVADGDTVTKTGASANDEFEKVMGMTLDTNWKTKDLSVAVTLWMVNPQDPQDLIYVNGTNVPQKGDFKDCSTAEEEEEEEEEKDGHSKDHTVGVDEIDTESMELYPNPVQNLLNIELSSSSDLSIEVSDLLGKVVLSQTANATNRTMLDVSSLPNGLYMVKVKTPTKTYLERVIVK